MSKILIEEYKGYGIYFDADRETFHCDHADYYDFKSKQSFSAIKKYINEHIKANDTFKPFITINATYGMELKNIKSIHGNGNLITDDAKQISINEELFVYTKDMDELLNERKAKQEEFDLIQYNHRLFLKQNKESIKAKGMRVSEYLKLNQC